MLLEDVIVGVQLVVFLLEAGGLGLGLVSEAVVKLKLLAHLLEFIFFLDALGGQIFELDSLLINRFLQVADMEISLSLLLFLLDFGFIYGSHIFI